MSVYDQQITSYSDTTPHRRVISDVIGMIDPYDTPLIAALGGLDTARSKFRIGLNGYKIEVLEDELDPLSDTANQGTTITTTVTYVTVTDGSIFQVGHVIQIDDEYMVVSAVSSQTVSVYSRSYGGTNATHADGSTVYIVGMARLEGDDADYGPIVDVTAPYNYTSIFQKGINVSRTQREISQYGKGDELMYQANKAVPHLMRLVESMAFHGVRAAGSATAPRSAGGLNTYVTDNTVAAGGAIAKADIDGLAEKLFGDGGRPDLLVANHAVVNDIRTLIDSSSFVRVSQENTMFGMQPITRVFTQYGELKLIPDRFCPVARAYMLDSRNVGFYTLSPFGVEDMAKTGDSDKLEVVGEFSLMVRHDKGHGQIITITS